VVEAYIRESVNEAKNLLEQLIREVLYPQYAT